MRSAATMPPAAEEVLRRARYVPIQRLGHGGMAEVWLARAQGPDGFQKEVAIKFPHGAFAEDPGFRARFLREARLMAQMSHANIAQVFELIDRDGCLAMVMEYVRGPSLRALLTAERSGLPVAIACTIAAELACGLAYAHDLRGPDGTSLGLVHRDVSPGNCVLSLDGEVKLIDFGIAAVDRELTQGGVVKGKLAYMSPEQTRNDRLDARSDLFALGALLYELLTGAPAFDGEDDAVIIDRLRRGETIPLRRRVADLSVELEEAVHTALAPEAGDRFADALAFRQALRPFTQGLGAPELGHFIRSRARDLPGSVPAEPTRAVTQQVDDGDIAALTDARVSSGGAWGFWLALTFLLAPLVLGGITFVLWSLVR
ncbi:MAG: serine/threonine protein kinase [Deltaproteobacteria bacterium]|nr:serine/threonine protein kinase [Deltaproteobacteria bacterium]